jgi:lauroyl/myristoyl acyltransferase
MRKHSYKLAIFLSRHVGLWFFAIFSWFIAAGYFLFFPLRVADSLKFYRALFPDRGFFYHLLCVWKQYHNFTDVFLDRFLVQKDYSLDLDCVRDGWEYLNEAAEKKTGAIIVMSHIGNWELAAQLLKLRGLPIMLFLGEKHKEQIEKMQKETLEKSGLKIVTTSENESSPFAILEGVNFLRQGGVVSLTGDRLWGNQRFVTVNFLGHEARLPDIPHLLALMSGAPLFTFFIFQSTPRKYYIKVLPGRQIFAASRAERSRVILESAQAYASELEKMARQHPFEWYHFEPFLGRKIDSGNDSEP